MTAGETDFIFNFSS